MNGVCAAIGVAALTRILVIAAAYAGSQSNAATLARDDVAFAPLLRWDAGHYRSIIEHGYSFPSPASGSQPAAASTQPVQSTIAFFPLYPLICRIIAPLVGVPLAMVLVANGCAIAAGLALFVWMRRRGGERVALWTVAVAFCWPAAAFWSFGYAESLTLLLTIIACSAAERSAATTAGFSCAMATASRPTAVWLPLLAARAMWAAQTQARGKIAARRRAVLVGLVGLTGAAAYVVYLWVLCGSPIEYFRGLQRGWIREDVGSHWGSLLLLGRIWDQFKYFGRALREFPQHIDLLIAPLTWQMPLALVLVVASCVALRRASPAWRALLLLAPLIFMQRYVVAGWTNFGVESMGRYLAIAAPAVVVLAANLYRAPRVARIGMLVALMTLQTNWAYQFGAGNWTG